MIKDSCDVVSFWSENAAKKEKRDREELTQPDRLLHKRETRRPPNHWMDPVNLVSASPVA